MTKRKNKRIQSFHSIIPAAEQYNFTYSFKTKHIFFCKTLIFYSLTLTAYTKYFRTELREHKTCFISFNICPAIFGCFPSAFYYNKNTFAIGSHTKSMFGVKSQKIILEPQLKLTQPLGNLCDSFPYLV